MPPEKNEDQRKETQERQIWAKNKGLLNRQSDLVPRVHQVPVIRGVLGGREGPQEALKKGFLPQGAQGWL